MRLKTLASTGAAAAATSLVGGLASRDVQSGWYRQLEKPWFQPPPIAFPIAWTALYTDIAVTSAEVIDGFRGDGHESDAADYERALAVNLTLNASWTWVFFRLHKLGAAVVVAAALTASSADLTRRAAAHSPVAGRVLSPYPVWCGFATVLSAAIWRRNR